MFISFCTLINYCSYSWPFKNISPWNYLGNISLFITIWSKNMLRTLLINCQCNEYTKVCLCIPPPLFCNHRLLNPCLNLDQVGKSPTRLRTEYVVVEPGFVERGPRRQGVWGTPLGLQWVQFKALMGPRGPSSRIVNKITLLWAILDLLDIP